MPEASALICLQCARQCLEEGEFAAAEQHLRRAIAQDAGLGLAYELLGKLLYRDSRSAEAAAVYRSWLDAAPADPVALHLVAATDGSSPPERASDGFIARIFGRAAPEFDLGMGKLGYCVPQLVDEAVRQLLPPHTAGLNVLDLGCGTGLCGELIRPLAQRLVGVDLSPEMLSQARLRGCYDELVAAEVSTYLRGTAERFDLILAADVFCYFGSLTDLFRAASSRLDPPGWLVFSVEDLAASAAARMSMADQGHGETPSVALLEHGRYAHGAAYVADALADAGLLPVMSQAVSLRFERGLPVAGLLTAAHPT